ncbi:DsrH/TusB family sulfur metabolism protein [Rodentibacter pneumotropicus]|uniref:DsrH/TusB family sulfur relay protein n=1 Tax=Rodentibacter pneumotropicus TaxID=758 RepID=UPI00232DE7B9|nr:DsrH/TusB family sulfur metabolism protein [Rodentibacter pneumotropicus]MDC2826019.1 DsrH/TusB family sulfur metabolism protein [Rodentibacter pneumotropicus]
MLYCFSQATYDKEEFIGYLSLVTEKDAVVLWQDAVLLVAKYPDYFKYCKGHCFVLEPDILARNLTALLPKANTLKFISLLDLVDITEQYSPQIAL